MSEKSSLSCQDICTIIEKCSSSGVSNFQIGSLKFSFNASEKTVTKPLTLSQVSERPVGFTPEIEEEMNNSAKMAELEAELIEKETELSILHIEDPAHYEELVAAGTIDEMVTEIGEEYAKLERG